MESFEKTENESQVGQTKLKNDTSLEEFEGTLDEKTKSEIALITGEFSRYAQFSKEELKESRNLTLGLIKDFGTEKFNKLLDLLYELSLDKSRGREKTIESFLKHYKLSNKKDFENLGKWMTNGNMEKISQLNKILISEGNKKQMSINLNIEYLDKLLENNLERECFIVLNNSITISDYSAIKNSLHYDAFLEQSYTDEVKLLIQMIENNEFTPSNELKDKLIQIKSKINN